MLALTDPHHASTAALPIPTHPVNQSFMMETTTPTKLPIGRIRSFFKQLRQLALLELFEKWFGFFIKLFWIALFVAFGIYLRKEYKKDIFYIQDFKVPPAWVERGYSGEVVKQAIVDDIDNIRNIVYEDEKSITGANEDGTEFLSDLSIEGFNLKAVTKSILSILGKKNKNIGGYVTLTDSTQRIAIRVTDQITQPLSIKKDESAQNLIHKATLEIMKVKSPITLIWYYQAKKDTVMARKVYSYMVIHRDLTKDYYFYTISITFALFENKFDKAFAWADSMQQKFPNDKLTFYNRATIHSGLIYYAPGDTTILNKNKGPYLENLLKANEPDRTLAEEVSIDESIYEGLIIFYYSQKKYKSVIDVAEKATGTYLLNARQNNLLAYAYMHQKDYKKSEKAVQKAIALAVDNGDYWDSLAEIYCIQKKDSLAVIQLATALKSPQKSASVSVAAYQKDSRWQRLQKRADFQALLKVK